MMIQHRDHILHTLVLLVNSCPPASKEEELPDLVSIERFMKARTITEITKLAPHDIAQVHLVRKQFRSIFMAPDDSTRVRLVNLALGSVRISPHLVEHDHLGIHFHYFPPFASLSDHLVADCAMALGTLIDSGEVSRLRICIRNDCNSVFIDSSRNRSRIFCSSKTCGARSHAEAYRKRNHN